MSIFQQSQEVGHSCSTLGVFCARTFTIINLRPSSIQLKPADHSQRRTYVDRMLEQQAVIFWTKFSSLTSRTSQSGYTEIRKTAAFGTWRVHKLMNGGQNTKKKSKCLPHALFQRYAWTQFHWKRNEFQQMKRSTFRSKIHSEVLAFSDNSKRISRKKILNSFRKTNNPVHLFLQFSFPCEHLGFLFSVNVITCF